MKGEHAYRRALRIARSAKDPDALREALPLLERSAAAGHPKALCALGTWYAFGVVVRKNYQTANEHFLQAAALGNAEAQFNLAVSLELGKGIERDLRAAFKWYRLAAENGDRDAQSAVARCLVYGIGVEANQEKALRWIRRAARRGDPENQYALGRAYHLGEAGLRPNRRLARLWLERAAAAGYEPAVEELLELDDEERR